MLSLNMEPWPPRATEARAAAHSEKISGLFCRACSHTVDPYLEQEGTLVLLDIALQSQAVLRHVLVNSEHTLLILKMVLITLIVDGYCRLDKKVGGSED